MMVQMLCLLMYSRSHPMNAPGTSGQASALAANRDWRPRASVRVAHACTGYPARPSDRITAIEPIACASVTSTGSSLRHVACGSVRICILDLHGDLLDCLVEDCKASLKVLAAQSVWI